MFIIAFFIIEANTPTEGYWITDTPIDRYIPFIPQFVWGYVLWYPLFAVVGIPQLIWDGDAFKRWMYYMMAALTITLIFDVAIPNGQDLRPQVPVTDASTWMLSLIWGADTPTNVFPSMHVLGCIGDVAGVLDSRIFNKKWKWVIIAACVVCSASTVLVKQHAFIDTAAAFVFALPILLAVYGRKVFRKDRLDA